MRSLLLLMAAILAGAPVLNAQTVPDDLKPILGQEIQPVSVVAFQLSQYLAARIPKLPSPASAEQWTSEGKRWREHILNDVAYHGWPREWVDAAPKFEDLGVVETGQGYRLHKLRFEIVPGFDSTAILYEPERTTGRAPAILNVHGHDPLGKAAEYKQKRCINFAKHGIMALNLEWFAFGELAERGNEHWFGGHLDLVGANELGLFYLEMRRGLDYLYDHPQVDRNRIGVTGLSGGGWQTIVLSSLDERVRVSVPVAGFSSLRSRIEAKRYGDLGDIANPFMRTAWRALVSADTIHRALLKTRPYETAPGAADLAFQEALADLVKTIENSCADAGCQLESMVESMVRARERFQRVPAFYDREVPLIGVVGEIFCRLNTFSNEDLIRKLESYGAEACLSHISEWVDYTNNELKRKLHLTGRDISLAMGKAYLRSHIQHADELAVGHRDGPEGRPRQ